MPVHVEASHKKLRRLIGERFRYLSCEWMLVDVLGEEDRVVIEAVGACPDQRIQDDQFGQPSRRSVRTMTLAISDADGEGYSEDLLILLENRVRPLSDAKPVH